MPGVAGTGKDVEPAAWPDGSAPGTAGEALLRGAALLRLAGSATPRLDAEVLLGHVAGLTRERLLAFPEGVLTPTQAARYREALARREARCPVAYITGHREFRSLDFEVGPDVMIPRPETELLVEVAVGLAGAGLTLADVGTGSGAVALALANLLPGARVWAGDISPAALAVASRNATRLGLADRVIFRQGDLLDAFIGGPGRFDGIVANLPYVSDAEWERLAPGVRDFEPPLSLRGGPDGLDLLRRLARQLPEHLAPNGFVGLEVGPGQARAAGDLLLETGLLANIRHHRDLTGVERVVSARSRRDPEKGFAPRPRTE